MSVRQRILTALACYAVTSLLAAVFVRLMEYQNEQDIIRGYQMIAELNREKVTS